MLSRYSIKERGKLKKIYLFFLSLLVFTASAFAEERLLEIRARKFSYTPNIIRVNKGDLVKVRLVSEDVTHGFFLDGYGFNISAHPGQEGHLEFVADRTGRFSFRCSVTCGEFHPYMVGYLIVGPNSRFGFYTLLTVVLGLGSLTGTIIKRRR
jgi:cytochrome c oxidase subunit 2